MRKINLIAYFILTTTLIFTYYYVFNNHWLLDLIFIILSLSFLYALFKLLFVILKDSHTKLSFRNLGLDILFTFLGAYVTFGLAYTMGMHVVIASALIGILGHIFLKKNEVAVYCGSFAGMTSVLLLNPLQMVLLALLCGFIYALSNNVLKGLGGKLGTIAFTSGLLTFWIFKVDYAASITIGVPIINLILVAVLGMVLTYYMQHKFKQTATFASASTSLLFALIVIPLSTVGSIYATLFFAASFAGMSAKDKIKTPFFVVLTGVFVGIIYYALYMNLNGVGGKLGTIALISTSMAYGLYQIYEMLLKQINYKKLTNL